MKFSVVFSLIVFLSINVSFAQNQKRSMEWGEVPQEHLDIVDFPADSNATAIILGDFGDVSFDNRYDIYFERHTRIKILSSSGFDQGDIRLTYYAANRSQRINNIKAQTINQNPDGTLQYHEVSSSEIHHEDLDGNLKAYIFTMPALEEGSIIEYSYRMRSTNPTFLRSWNFQTSQPTLWSQFEVDIPNALGYVQLSHNSVPFHISDVEDGAGRANISRRFTWAVKDAPAIRSEPYMTTTTDHLTRINFQLNTIHFPGRMPQKVMEDWDTLVTDLRRNSNFGRQSTNRAIRRQVNELTEGLDDPKEIMQAIYDYVRLNIEWDGRRRIFTDDGITRAYSRKNGNGSEIALLLTNMLDRAGLDAKPVLISTRNNGQIQQLYPILNQFNHVLTLVTIGEQQFLLDATDPHRPYNLLPFNALTDSGLIIRSDGHEWIDIFNIQSYQTRSMVNGELDADGTITGSIQVSDEGYSGYRSRRAIRDDGEDDYFTALVDNLPNTDINSQVLENIDLVDEALITKLEFTNQSHALVSGDYIYLNPFLLNKIDRNPFTLPNRSFPVDYGHPYDYYYIFNFALPEGYEVVEMPENQRLAFDDKSQYTQMIAEDFGRVQVMSRFVIADTVYEPELYEQLQSYYDQIIQSHSEQIVLRKIATETN